MPQGKHKARMNVMVKRLALRQARLEMKLFTCNPCTLLVREAKFIRLQALPRKLLLPFLSRKLFHTINPQVGKVLIAMNTYQVLVALDRPDGAAAVRTTQFMTPLRIIGIEETEFILFQWEFRPALEEDEIFKLL
jgi:hypothetical protein